MNDELLIARLREALVAGEQGAGRPSESDPAELLAVLSAERSRDEVRALLDRALENDDAAFLMRLLPALDEELAAARSALAGRAAGAESERRSQRQARPPRRGRRPSRWARAGAIAASLVAFAVLSFPLLEQRGRVAEFRAGEKALIEPLVERGETLPREAFVLSWAAAEEGALYTLEVASEDLDVLLRVEDLDATSYRVPPEALAGLPAGANVLWRVEALLPDARRVDSTTFRVRLE